MFARRWYVVALLVGVASATSHAQGLPDPTPLPELEGTSSTKIPVTMDGGREVLSAETAASSTSSAPFSLEEPLDPKTYICGPGDAFELNFWGQQNFRLRVAADLEGRTFITKIGFLTVNGLPLAEVRKLILKKVGRYYPGLNADVTLVYPRTFQVHVVNNVKQPGAYRSNALERVSSLLGKAGGVSGGTTALASGSRRRIEIKRKNGNTLHADLVMYELTGDTSYNPFVLDGDVISVPFAETVVTVSGAIRKPGVYELIKTKDLTELLALSGGFSSSVTRSLPIRIQRRNASEHDAYIDVAFASGAAPNAELRDDDEIQVRGTSDFERSVLLVGAVPGSEGSDSGAGSKLLAYVEGDTVYSLLQRAGGIRTIGDLRQAYVSHPTKSTPELIAVDLEALLNRRDFSADKPIGVGDTIIVPPMQYSVHVDGAVAKAGPYAFNPTFGISEYIARAGGRTRTARDLRDVKIIDMSGVTHNFSSRLKPSPGDLILVPERNFSRAEVAQLILAGAGIVLSGVAITLAATR
jgi:protein involved in polysaccharide export with SLBB domain